MKLANLSICLVLAFVFGGCCPSCNSPSPNEVANEQSFENLDLQVIGDDEIFNSKSKLSPKLLKSNKEPIILIGNFDEKSIKNIEKSFNANLKDKNLKERIGGLVLVDEINSEVKRFVPSDLFDRLEKIKFKPIPFCAEFPEKCFKIKCVGKNCLKRVVEFERAELKDSNTTRKVRN